MELNTEELQIIFNALNKDIGGLDKAKKVLDLAEKLKSENERLNQEENKNG